jgi:hypothetical protein
MLVTLDGKDTARNISGSHTRVYIWGGAGKIKKKEKK